MNSQQLAETRGNKAGGAFGGFDPAGSALKAISSGSHRPLSVDDYSDTANVVAPIGVPEMDTEHCQLIVHHNALVDALSRRHDVEAFALGYHSLVYRVRQHFIHEEQLMRAIGYNGIELHKVVHKKLLRDAEDVLVRLIARHEEHECLTVTRYFKHWLTNHIMTHDRKIGEFLSTRDWPS